MKHKNNNKNGHSNSNVLVPVVVVVLDPNQQIVFPKLQHPLAQQHLKEKFDQNSTGNKKKICNNSNYQNIISKLKSKIKIMAKPYFLKKLEDVCVVEGQSVQLIARVQGATSVSWIRNGKTLPNCPDFQQYFLNLNSTKNEIGLKKEEQQGSECSLQIADVFIEDTGRFICKAYNSEVGTTSLCSARVTVSEKKLYTRRMAEKEDMMTKQPTAIKQNGKCDFKYELDAGACQNGNGTPEVSPIEQVQVDDDSKNCYFAITDTHESLPQSQLNYKTTDEEVNNSDLIQRKNEISQAQVEISDTMVGIEDTDFIVDLQENSTSKIVNLMNESKNILIENGSNVPVIEKSNVLFHLNQNENLDKSFETDQITDLEMDTMPKENFSLDIKSVEFNLQKPETSEVFHSESSHKEINSVSNTVYDSNEASSQQNEDILVNNSNSELKLDSVQINNLKIDSDAVLQIIDDDGEINKEFYLESSKIDKCSIVQPIIYSEKLESSSLEENNSQVKVLKQEKNILIKQENIIANVPASEIGRGPQVMGPSYILALKGESVHLRIKVSGNPHPINTWSRAGKCLESNDRMKVEEKGEFSSVNIENVNYDDSGRYVAKVENKLGTVIHTTNLSVEGPPEPPSLSPTAMFNESQNNIIVSWSGSPYDGGSALTGYHLLISQDEEEWTLACQCTWLTATIPSPERGSSYRFRIHAENAYGIGPPSHVSIPVVVPGVCSISENSTNRLEGGIIEDLIVKNTPIKLGSYLEFYEKGEELGKGRFGTVFKVTNKITRKEFASKIVRCIKGTDKDKVRQEVEIMNLLRHTKLIELVDAYETAREIVIITEKINGGELFERVVADDFTLTEFDCVGFMRQIMDGVRFIHSKNIIHLDLKPENILCMTRSTYSIKIIDFGLSQKYDSTIPLRVLFGTPEFVAPEIINYEPISPASDMWALGVITYVLLSGLSPFMGDSDSETFSNITAADFDFEDDAFSTISNDAKEFISSLLVKRQEKRLTTAECLSHKWLAYPEPTKNIVIPKDKLKRFIIRRKWQKTGNAIRALGRITMLYSTRRSSEATASAGSTVTSTTGAGSIDSGISLSPTATNSCGIFDPNSGLDKQTDNKRLLQRQSRVDSSFGLT